MELNWKNIELSFKAHLLLEKNLSKATVSIYLRDMRIYRDFVIEKFGLESPHKADKEVISAFIHDYLAESHVNYPL